MFRSIAPAAAAALVLAFPGTAQETTVLQGEIKKLDYSDRNNPPPVAPISVSVTLSDKAPDGLAVPASLHDTMSGVAKIGDRKVLVLVGQSTTDAALPDRLLIDLDGDGKLSDQEKIAIATSKNESRGNTVLRSQPVEAALTKGAAFRASFSKFGDRSPSVSLQFDSYLEGTFDAGIVAVVDKDFDGKLGTAGDMWTIGTKGGRPVGEYGLMKLDEHVFHDGKLYGISVDGTSIELSSRAAKGLLPADARAQRERVEHIWMERFDESRESFVKARGLDTSRPVAKEPVQWHYVTFDEAIALGNKTGKPVFVDVMAFWCVWCYRMDWCTYNDAAVTKTLNEDFVAVKIIQEQDLVGDYDMLMKEKLKARGIPAMGVFNADGEVVHTIGGWKKPEDFLAELEAGQAAFRGGK